MPRVDVAAWSGAPACYLDTSAVMAVLVAQDPSAPKLETVRAAKVRAALKRTSCTFLTSPLVFQELCHTVRRKVRDGELKKRGFDTWRAYKQQDATACAAADARALATSLDLAKRAADELHALSVKLDHPEVPPSERAAYATKVRKRHRHLVKNFPAIDSMDALHIVLGVELGVQTFMSFDAGWETVSNIDVLG